MGRLNLCVFHFVSKYEGAGCDEFSRKECPRFIFLGKPLKQIKKQESTDHRVTSGWPTGQEAGCGLKQVKRLYHDNWMFLSLSILFPLFVCSLFGFIWMTNCMMYSLKLMVITNIFQYCHHSALKTLSSIPLFFPPLPWPLTWPISVFMSPPYQHVCTPSPKTQIWNWAWVSQVFAHLANGRIKVGYSRSCKSEIYGLSIFFLSLSWETLQDTKTDNLWFWR